MANKLLNRLNAFGCGFFFFSFLSVIHVSAGPYNGYNFYGNGVSMSTKSCQLLDMSGKVIHEWKSTYPLHDKCYLLRDSSVLWPCTDNADAGQGKFPASGVLATLMGGRFQIIKWDAQLPGIFPTTA
jgi:hypothetical protein